jgi:hypothetical protein
MTEPQDAGIGQPMTSAAGKLEDSRQKGLDLQIGEDLLPRLASKHGDSS